MVDKKVLIPLPFGGAKAYYARPMSLYRTAQENRDIRLINKMGYEVQKFPKSEVIEKFKNPMDAFYPLVMDSQALFFRGFIDGKLGAGIVQEIRWALDADIPVLELPQLMQSRVLTVDETREYLSYLGQR